MGYIRECVNCKYSRGGGSDVWCEHDPKGKETYMVETDCPYFEGDKYYQGPQTLTIKAESNDEVERLIKENKELKQEIEALKMEIAELRESEGDNYNISDGLW